jgi:hypothetical protein
MEIIYQWVPPPVPSYNTEPGEELRPEFEQEYGKDRNRKGLDGKPYGQWLDLSRLPNGDYRSIATFFAWRAFRHGRGVHRPNEEK